jgi:hypothetical protein
VRAVGLRLHGLVGAPAAGVLQRLRAPVDHDDLGLGQRAEGLDADVAQPAAPNATV